MRVAILAEERRYRWEIGDLRYKLRPHQRADYHALWDAILDPAVELYSYLASRRRGKSFVSRLVALEFCIRQPESNVNIGAPVAKEMRKINRSVFRDILRDCPAQLTPELNATEGTYLLPNGSAIFTAGLNNDNADAQRGNNAHLNLLDEPGFVDELGYCVEDVYMPQTDTTEGTTLLVGTPPKTPAHEHKRLHAACEAKGNAIVRTIHDTDYPEERKRQIAARFPGGMASTTWQREYECKFVVDDKLQVIREWRDEFAVEVERTELFAFWHKYVCADLGVRDLHATLFAYYDFKGARLVVEDEWIENGPGLTTERIANMTRAYEARLAYADARRWCDNNNPLLVNDLGHLHKLPFRAVTKSGSEREGPLQSMVNEARLWIAAGRVIVHPRCKNLLGCLRTAIWKDSKDGRFIGRELERVAEFGHFDALMALVYLIRHVDQTTNPLPADLGFDPATMQWRRRGEANHALAGLVGGSRRVA